MKSGFLLTLSLFIIPNIAYAEWSLTHHQIEMFSDDYFYIDQQSFNRRGNVVVFTVRVGAYEDPYRANYERNISLDCADKTVTLLHEKVYNTNLSASRNIGFPSEFSSMSIADQEIWNAISAKVC